MISWRYHLVSIVAVFLALGLGVLAGTTVLNDNLVHNLQSQTRQLKTDLSDYRSAVDDYTKELATMNAFADQAMPYVVGAKLANEPMVVVTQDGVDGRALTQTRRALDLAGADVLTTLTVHSTVAAGTPGTQHDLATLLGMPQDSSPEDLAAGVARALALRLSKDPRVDLSGKPDLLGELLSQGFLTASAPGLSDATLAGIGGRGQIVVTIGGGTSELSPSSSAFLVPFVSELVALGVTTGAGESVASGDGFIAGVRAAPNDAGNPLVTVDDVDTPIGGSAMVLGLQSMILGGAGGDFGVKPGASRLLPPLA